MRECKSEKVRKCESAKVRECRVREWGGGGAYAGGVMHQSERVLAEVLGPVHMQMRRAEAAYRSYLDDRKFIYTLVLRDSNTAVRDLLLERGYLLPTDLQDDALQLIQHLDIWLVKWHDMRARTNPSLDDPFVLANESVYPKRSAQNLEAMYATVAGAERAAGRSVDAA